MTVIPSKHFNVVSMLVDMTSRRGTTSSQRWNNVVYMNVGIWTYFNVDINNVRRSRNNVVIFNVQFYNVGKSRNNVVKMTISKNNKTNISNRMHEIQSFNCYFIIFFTLLPMLRGIWRRVLTRPRKFFKDHERYYIART